MYVGPYVDVYVYADVDVDADFDLNVNEEVAADAVVDLYVGVDVYVYVCVFDNRYVDVRVYLYMYIYIYCQNWHGYDDIQTGTPGARALARLAVVQADVDKRVCMGSTARVLRRARGETFLRFI